MIRYTQPCCLYQGPLNTFGSLSLALPVLKPVNCVLEKSPVGGRALPVLSPAVER